MKALRYHGTESVTLDEVEEPQLRDGWTLVAPFMVGICGTDVKHYRLGPFGMPIDPHPLSGARLPLVLGHEIAGVVQETTSTDGRITPGQRVAVDGCVKCGTCWHCLRGHYVRCERGAILGISAHGGLAELVAVPNYGLHPLPDELTDAEGALVEPISVATHAVRRLRVQVGDTLCIIGGGVIGLSVLQVARAAGAALVGVVEPLAPRRQLALELGADFAVPPPDEDSGEQRALNARFGAAGGADVGLDCVGSSRALSMAMASTRHGGRVGCIGSHTELAQVPIGTVVGYEKELIGAVAYEDDFPRAIALIKDHRVDPRRIVTDIVPLSSAVSEGIEALAQHPDEHIKILVRP
jgi:(R,R)-butanediol dehydrogenase/meso-butanediol dehydrogenase/diacetyl reductase